jgi:hypothetical protein
LQVADVVAIDKCADALEVEVVSAGAAGKTNMTDIAAELAQAEIADGGGAITLLEFCDRYKLLHSTFYEKRKRGLGLRAIHIGQRVLLAWRAIREWVESKADRWSAEQLLADERK